MKEVECYDEGVKRMNSPYRSFEELVVWQKAHQFVIDIYTITKTFPVEEKFGLVQQFRRAAVSIAANIAEGYRKRGLRDKVRFFNIAEGSLEECRYYLILGKDIGYLKDIDILWKQSDTVRKLLVSYSKTISVNP